MRNCLIWSAVCFLATFLPTAVLAAGPEGPFDGKFWHTWSDGNAELNSYDLVFPRYGENHSGTAVSIFVTEPFSESKRVKSDDESAADAFPAMKLNLVMDFQTGIYDYNTMTSSFLALKEVNGRAAGNLSKVSFSSQEWCGQTYQQGLFDESKIRLTSHSYFDGEADSASSIDYPKDGISEDVLFHWARGFAQPFLKPGEKKKVPMLRSMMKQRLLHRKAEWFEAELSRSEDVQTVTVPAGSFRVDAFVVKIPRDSWTFYVEREWPRRIVKWETAEGQTGSLVASKRMKYWQAHSQEDESMLKELGLMLRPKRTM